MVIDLINAFGPEPFSPTPELPVSAINAEFCAKTNAIIDFFSKHGCHILFLCDHHSEADFIRMNEPPHARIGTKAAELMTWIHQPPDSHIFRKRTYDGSTNPQLVEYLKKHNIANCFALGTSTGVCVRHSIEGFIAKGITPWYVVEDLLGDIFPSRHRYFLQYFLNHSEIHLTTATEIQDRLLFDNSNPIF